MSLVLDLHREYLSDRVRVGAYERALAEVVRPGDVVLDLGSGTGILGLLALRAGAARVFAVDDGGIIELAREIAGANGIDGKITFLKGLSTEIELPERANVLVTDQIGRFGFEAGLLEYLADARERLLVPGAILVPSRLEMMVAPVQAPEIRDRIEFWKRSPAGFDFGPARAVAANTGYPVRLSSEDLLSEPSVLASHDLSRATADPFRGEVRCMAARRGRMDGLGGWFSATLSGSVELTNSPLSRERIERRNVLFPIDRPVDLEEGDVVRAGFTIVPKDTLVSWTVEIEGRTGSLERFSHSTWRGMLVSREELARTAPEHVPRLTPRGRARLSVLELSDGTRTLAEIEREVLARHGDLFRSAAESSAFVAEVVTRYSR